MGNPRTVGADAMTTQVNVRFPPGHPVEKIPPGKRGAWVREQVRIAIEHGDDAKALDKLAGEVAALRRLIEGKVIVTAGMSMAGPDPAPAPAPATPAPTGKRMEGWDDL